MWERVATTMRDRRAGAVLILLGAVAAYWFLRLPRPPEPRIVATYRGGEVTREELRSYLHEFLPRCSRHASCERHGEGHDECGPEESCEQFLDCPPDEHARGHDPLVYRRAARALIVDRLIAGRVAEKRLTDRGEVKHLMKHVGEEISLSGLDRSLHSTEMRIDATEVRDYYEKNPARFGDRTLSDAAPQIEQILSGEKEADFLKGYVRRLTEEAVVSVDHDLLRWPEPSETELEVLFAEKSRDLVRPARARVLLVSVPVTADGAQAPAGDARSRLIGGATKQEVASALDGVAGAAVSVRWIEEKSDLGRALRLSRRTAEEVTGVADHGGMRYVARLLKREERRRMTFEEARAGLLEEARKSARERVLKDNGGATLFTVRGKPYSLGEFWQEFQELPRTEQARYRTFEERSRLLDRMVERAVLLQRASEAAPDTKSRKDYDRIRTTVLRQVLHQEEVDDRLAVTDEEAKAFFESRRRSYRRPVRVKVSCIRTSSAKSSSDARRRADAALEELKGTAVDDARFAEVAGKYSDDPDVSRTGGKIEDWISETDDLLTELLTHRFHEHVLGLKPGEVSRVFEAGNDFYVVWAREREEARERSFDEVREHVMRDLKALRHEEMTSRMEFDLLGEADARIYDYTILKMIAEEKQRSRQH